jgi:hypothetical protein
MVFQKSLFFLLLLTIVFQPDVSRAQSKSLSLEVFLKEVLTSSQELKAIELDIQSLRLEIKARDIELSPTFDVNLLRFWDDRPSLSSNRQSSGKSVELAMNKPLVSGTEFNLSSYLETAQYTTTDEQNLLNWQSVMPRKVLKDS